MISFCWMYSTVHHLGWSTSLMEYPVEEASARFRMGREEPSGFITRKSMFMVVTWVATILRGMGPSIQPLRLHFRSWVPMPMLALVSNGAFFVERRTGGALDRSMPMSAPRLQTLKNHCSLALSG